MEATSDKVSISRTKAFDCPLRTTLAPLLYSHGRSNRITSGQLSVIKLLLGRKQEPQHGVDFFEITRKLVGHIRFVLPLITELGSPVRLSRWSYDGYPPSPRDSLNVAEMERFHSSPRAFFESLGNSDRGMLGKDSRKRGKKEEEWKIVDVCVLGSHLLPLGLASSAIDWSRAESSAALNTLTPVLAPLTWFFLFCFCLSMSIVAIACCGWRLGV